MDYIRIIVNTTMMITAEHLTQSEDICDNSNNNQGVVRMSTVNGTPVIWKVSQGYDFSVDHEARVMRALEPLKQCCPHYVYPISVDVLLRTQVPAPLYTDNDPDDVPVTVLTMEYVQDDTGTASQPLEALFIDGAYSERQSFSVVMQVLNALWFGHKQAGFTHYDLHPGNVLVRKQPLNTGANLYITDSSVSLVPTYGETPVIIDYGYSHVSAHDYQHFFSTMEHASIGYFPCVSHPWIDTRLITALANRVNNFSFISRNNSWTRWLATFPRKGFSKYYQQGWEEDVSLGVVTDLGAWLRGDTTVADTTSSGDTDTDTDECETTIRIAADTLGALSKFPFISRVQPENGAQVNCMSRILGIINRCVYTHVDNSLVAVVYGIVRCYIHNEDMEKFLKKMKKQYKDKRCRQLVTKKKVNELKSALQEIAGYVEYFHHAVWQARANAWEEKADYIKSKYRNMESIAEEALAHAPEGIGADLKALGRVTVYDMTTKTTTVIEVPEFPETSAEITLLYRNGEITRRVHEIYTALSNPPDPPAPETTETTETTVDLPPAPPSGVADE